MEEEKGDQLDQIKELMSKATEEMDRFQRIENGILVQGTTGSGKSTLVNGFSGLQLNVRFDERTAKWIINSDGIAVGYGSCTKTPRLVPTLSNEQDQVILCDCPGFTDTNGFNVEIVNSFCNMLLIKKIKNLKIVLAVTESSITDNHGNGFVDSINNFTKQFKQVEFLKNSVALCITKCDEQKKIMHLKNELQSIKDMNKNITAESKKILDYVFDKDQKAMSIFHKVTRDEEIRLNDLFQKIDQSIVYQRMDQTIQSQLRLSISEQQKNYARNLFTQSNQRLDNTLRSLKNGVLRFLEQINDQSIYNDALRILEKRIENNQIQIIQIQDDYTFNIDQNLAENQQSYLQIILIEDLYLLKQKIDELQRVVNLEQLLQNVDQIFEILRQNSANERYLMEKNQESREIHKILEFLQYLLEVCDDRSIQYESVQEIFRNTNETLENAIRVTSDNIQVNRVTSNLDYLQRAYTILEKENVDQRNQIRMAEIKYQIGVYYFNQRQYTESSKEFINALQILNFNIEDAQNKLESIFVYLTYLFSNDQKLVELNNQENQMDIYRQLFLVFSNQLSQTFIDISLLIKNQILEASDSNYENLAAMENVDQIRIFLKKLTSMPYGRGDEIKTLVTEMIELMNQRFILRINQLPERDYHNFNQKQFEAFKIKEIDQLIESFKNSFEGICNVSKLRNDNTNPKLVFWFLPLQEIYQDIQRFMRENIRMIIVDRNLQHHAGQDQILRRKLALVQKLPDDIDCIRLQAEIYIQLSQFYRGNDDAQSSQLLQQAINIDNGQLKARKALAELYFQMQPPNYQQAIELFKSIKAYSKVKACFLKIIEDDLEDTVFREQFADFLCEIGEYSQAVSVLNEVISIFSLGFNDNEAQRVFQKIQQVVTWSRDPDHLKSAELPVTQPYHSNDQFRD